MPPGKVIRVTSPFYCPCGAGRLQRQDLKKLFDVVGSENDPTDPTPSLWFIHIQARLIKALGKDTALGYIELVRQVKAGGISEEREQKLRKKMAEIEARALPVHKCGYCQEPETERKLSSCSRCLTQFYCNREHQLAAWPEHKKSSCKKVKRPALANAQAMQRRFGPDHFSAPSEEDVREVQEKVHVKVCIQHVERFWVEVDTVLEWPKFVGRVDNFLKNTNVHGLKYNDRILFEWDNAYEVQFPLDWQSILYTERG